MATTERGIYYPGDYSATANIPADMKEMAESVDEAIGNSEAGTNAEIQLLKTRMTSAENKNAQQDSNISTLQGRIGNVESKNAQQDTAIQTNATNIEGLTEDLEDLEDTIAEHTQAIEELESGQATQDTAIEALQTECERLRDDLANTTASVEGEGESITLNNTANARFKKFSPEGNSKQETTSIEDGDEYDSPSPDHEQPINSAGDDANELDVSALTDKTFYGLNIQLDGDKVKINGTRDTSGWVGIINFTLPVGTHTFSFESEGTMPSEPKVLNSNYNQQSNTFAVNDATAIYRIAVGGTVGDVFNCTLKLKIQKGSIATGYSPYGMGSITEKIVNKNLLKLEGNTSQGITSKLNIDGSFRISGTCASTWAHITPATSRKLEAGDYVFSISKALSYVIYISLRFEDESYTNHSIPAGSTFKTITTSKNIIRYEISISSLTAGNTIDDTIFLQLEEGSTATEIIPHTEQTYTIPTQEPMRSIGDVRDGFVKKNGKWYERHNIKKYIFDGTEHCQYSSTTFVFDQITDIDYQNINNVPLSNYYLGVPPVSAAREITENNVITIGNIQYRIYIKDSRYTTSNDFKAMLKDLYDNNNPAYIFYIKEQPTDLPCTAEQEAILNQIEQEAKTYEGITYILGDEVPAYVEAKAYKDVATTLNNLETRIQVLETEV